MYAQKQTESNEKATFFVKSIKRKEKGTVIRIGRKLRYSTKDVQAEIDNVFNNWHNEINFNVKRATRAATKNKKGNRGQIDLNRHRFHLKEEQVKSDLKHLLEEEAKFDEKFGQDPKYRNRFGIYWQDNGFGRENSTEFEDNIQSAMYQQPNYNDRHHISGITVKLGFLNEPDVGDPFTRTRRTRALRVNYQTMEETENQNMYHQQEVHFFDGIRNDFNSNHNGLHLNKGHDIEIPVEEKGHNVTVGQFNIVHGTIVRLNYNSSNITLDAKVVSIKRNQLSAETLVGQKRKRIWYKELRGGKINIVPATAYR